MWWLDATDRVRPDGERWRFGQSRPIRARRSLDGDVDTLANGARGCPGCDWVGTTLFGYTEATTASSPPAWDLIQPLREQLPTTTA